MKLDKFRQGSYKYKKKTVSEQTLDAQESESS